LVACREISLDGLHLALRFTLRFGSLIAVNVVVLAAIIKL
jgi:hypothetical protein